MAKALERLRRKLTIENLWIYIIKILVDEDKPLRPYTVKKILKNRYSINAASITVYTVMYKMTREGLLEKIHIDGDTLYKATPLAVHELSKAIQLMEDIVKTLKQPRNPS